MVKQDRAVRTRAALVRAGAEEFAASGFAGASVARIAVRAGLTLGAMYFHFQNKEDLAREIVRNQPNLVVTPHASQGLQHAVDITLTWACRLLDDPVLLAGARLVMDQEHFIDPAENSHRQWADVLARDLHVADRRRELRAGVDVDAMARLLVNACTGAQMHARMESGHQDLPQRVAETWRCLLPALAVPSVIRRLEFGEERGRCA
ncbi:MULTISPECIES: ScbR family autoregulator-binding transcription factor [Streptomyces]|uniref:ScbR family autoregulator-binding transcription factor n=1 Tax=Streptomyces TaxID=1883 RepID=UPI002249422A|nr:ScbR family autoregulator-binding transcription factor [Streptomyces sp. JHD 1]MCX2969367.1 ScbR family autoregulator-binding transcription factor [Streptomyces sp. JHD 1]